MGPAEPSYPHLRCPTFGCGFPAARGRVGLVRRRSGGDVALIAADELRSLLETAHLMRSPRNAQRLLGALARARGERIAPTALKDLERLIDGDS